MMVNLFASFLPSPLGKMFAVFDDKALFYLAFVGDGGHFDFIKKAKVKLLWRENAILEQLRFELDGYFSARLRQFHLSLSPYGSTFQKEAWRVLRAIPYGETLSYSAQAQAMGRARAVRAVAQANARNPIVILQPCHRVIAKNGALHGFSSGLWRKKFLLDLEAK